MNQRMLARNRILGQFRFAPDPVIQEQHANS
jgi:hypothetical protein